MCVPMSMCVYLCVCLTVCVVELMTYLKMNVLSDKCLDSLVLFFSHDLVESFFIFKFSVQTG